MAVEGFVLELVSLIYSITLTEQHFSQPVVLEKADFMSSELNSGLRVAVLSSQLFPQRSWLASPGAVPGQMEGNLCPRQSMLLDTENSVQHCRDGSSKTQGTSMDCSNLQSVTTSCAVTACLLVLFSSPTMGVKVLYLSFVLCGTG